MSGSKNRKKRKKEKNISNILKRRLKNEAYGSLDVIEIEINFKALGSAGVVKCPKTINSFALELQKAITMGKHPTLNPVIDDVYEYKTDENNGFEAFEEFILYNGKFETVIIDNHQSYIKINLPIKIMWINIEPFLENKSFIIESAVIQTPMFKQEIK